MIYVVCNNELMNKYLRDVLSKRITRIIFKVGSLEEVAKLKPGKKNLVILVEDSFGFNATHLAWAFMEPHTYQLVITDYPERYGTDGVQKGEKLFADLLISRAKDKLRLVIT